MPVNYQADCYHANGNLSLSTAVTERQSPISPLDHVTNASLPSTPVKLEVNYTHHHILSITPPSQSTDMSIYFDALAHSISSNSPSKLVITKQHGSYAESDSSSSTVPHKLKEINIFGRTILYTADTLRDPPTLSYRSEKELEQLVKDWTESAYLTLEGVGVPLCFWRRLYSRTRPRAWDKIKDQWGKYRLFVAAFKSYETAEEFWDRMHALLMRPGERANFTFISNVLRKERVMRDSSDAEAAKEEYLGPKFDEEFSYRKGGKQLVLKRPHDIARRYCTLKKLSVYWDEQDSDEE